MNMTISARFDSIDAAESAARLIRHHINDSCRTEIRSKTPPIDRDEDQAGPFAVAVSGSFENAAWCPKTDRDEKNELYSIVHPCSTVSRAAEPDLRRDATLIVETSEEYARVVTDLMHSQGGLSVRSY